MKVSAIPTHLITLDETQTLLLFNFTGSACREGVGSVCVRVCVGYHRKTKASHYYSYSVKKKEKKNGAVSFTFAHSSTAEIHIQSAMAATFPWPPRVRAICFTAGRSTMTVHLQGNSVVFLFLFFCHR